MRLKADDDVRLRHMLQYAEVAAEFTRGRQRRDLDDDSLLELGTRKALEIVGEAAAPVTEATRLSHPEIPWAEIVGLRNRLVHGYDVVDHGILSSVLTVDLPVLVAALRSIVASAPKPPDAA